MVLKNVKPLLVVDLLRRAGIDAITASVMGRRPVQSSRNISIQADTLVEAVDFCNVKMIVLPGGRIRTENLMKNETVKKQCLEFAACKQLAAVCAAPSILATLGLLEGKKATCHPDFQNKMRGAIVTCDSVTHDGNIITGQGLGATIQFAFEIVRTLVDDAMVDKLKKEICYHDK